MGRGKVELKRIENTTSRQVSFSKRRNGLLKKAFELSILCDSEITLIIFSPSGKLYQFSSQDMDRTIAKYKNEVGLSRSDDNQQIKSSKDWRKEIEDMKGSIETLEERIRHLAGEDISKLGVKELNQLERQLKIGVERIRSKKRRISSELIKSLKCEYGVRREENNRLRRKVKLNEMSQEDQSYKHRLEDEGGVRI